MSLARACGAVGVRILGPLASGWVRNKRIVMAKPATIKIRLVSSAGTGYYYTTKKNPRTKPEKMALKKFDPVSRQHVVFNEAKIK